MPGRWTFFEKRSQILDEGGTLLWVALAAKQTFRADGDLATSILSSLPRFLAPLDFFRRLRNSSSFLLEFGDPFVIGLHLRGSFALGWRAPA